MTSPLNTDVTANERPVIVPTMPLARSRRSAGTSSVHAKKFAPDASDEQRCVYRKRDCLEEHFANVSVK